jgi:hypothetical protein
MYKGNLVLTKLNNNIWYVNQKQSYHGMEVGTRMTIIKLSDNSVVLISPVEINEELATKIQKIGVVSIIIAPNLYHHLYLSGAAKRYQSATIFAARGLKNKYPDLQIRELGEFPPDSFTQNIQYTELSGYAVQEIFHPVVLNEIVFFHLPSKTLILTDGAYHIGRSSPFISRLVAKLSGLYYFLGPTAMEKRASKDRVSLRESVNRILNWPFEAVIMAHGEVIESGGKTKFQKGFEWLS